MFLSLQVEKQIQGSHAQGAEVAQGLEQLRQEVGSLSARVEKQLGEVREEIGESMADRVLDREVVMAAEAADETSAGSDDTVRRKRERWAMAVLCCAVLCR